MAELKDVKGIGPKSLALLNKINIYTIEDLVTHYPFRYEILERDNLQEVEDGGKIVIDGRVESIPILMRFKAGLNKMNFRLVTPSGVVGVSIFNRAFLKNQLVVGTGVTVIGKLDKKKNVITAADIKLEPLSNKVKIEPVYHATSGLTNKNISTYINMALLQFGKEIPDYIPEEYIERYHFSNKKTSLNLIHNPSTEEKLKIAQNLKEIAKNVKVNHAELGGNVHNINNIYVEELNLRSKLFFEKLTPKTSIDDLDKFTDEMLNGYKEAKKHFIKGNKVFDEIDEKLLQYTFSHFQLDTYHALMQKRLYCLLKRDFEGIKKINEITDKIEKFGQEHFNTGKSRYYNKSGKTNSSGSKFNFNDFFNDTTKKAKSTLSEFLKKDDALKEFAQIVESDKLDKTVLKNIKRKFAVKYHPDKAKDDAQRAEYTKIFQEINDAIETLEKTLK